MYSLRCPVLQTRKLTRSYTAWKDFPSGSELLVSETVKISELQERHCDVLSVAIKQHLQGGEKRKKKKNLNITQVKVACFGGKKSILVLSTSDT